MNAIKLRNLLLGGIILTLALTGVFIYFASGYLSKETSKTVHAKIDAELSSQDIDKYKALKKLLEQNASSIDKANQVVKSSQEYEYQDQIIRDLNSYAAQTGVSVIGYDFGDSATNASTAVDPTIPVINGVKALTVNVTLSSTVPFDNYLKFVKSIEDNLTKMQVRGINLTPDDKSTGNISNPSVELIVYVK